ncbi:MAG: hypothetical protein LBE92_16045 [Chryseobacterium sp.]|jgi:hypothetical protein|uniref:hypothetical protein n=1 Tax=Chryseobacterium sp. TaxID=1871047 RepID=UPI0028352B22|nr:hypothetical protein [Chryseobacterium sp.]MDR2237634.1 hypothetical protein [Chryseobacterium sp.]
MENNHFLSPKLFKAAKSLWILFLICFITDFVTRFFDPDHKNTLSRILDYMSYALNALFFLWYFIVNKRWKSVVIILPFLLLFCFFMKDIRDIVDYYMPFEEKINSATLRKWTYMILQLITVFVIAKRYQSEEKFTGKNILLKLFALNLALFSLYYSDLGFIENMLGSASYDSKSTEFFVTFIYYFLSSIKSTAYLGAFLFLTGCLVKGEHIYTFSKNALEYAGRYFWTASFIMITCVIFIFFSLLESAFKLELDFFGKNLNMFGWVSTVVLILFFIISSRFTGQFLQERSLLKKKYYGAVGASVWIPVINIISLLMIRFDDKIKFLAPANVEKAKKIHLAVISLLLLFQFRKGIMAGKTDDILSCIIYIAAFITVAYIKRFTWIFPLVLGLIVTAVKVYPFYGVYAQDFIFKDYVLDFLKNTASIALILTVIVFYGIYYIAYQTLNHKK